MLFDSSLFDWHHNRWTSCTHHLSAIVNIEASDITLNALAKQYPSKLRAGSPHYLCRDERQAGKP